MQMLQLDLNPVRLLQNPSIIHTDIPSQMLLWKNNCTVQLFKMARKILFKTIAVGGFRLLQCRRENELNFEYNWEKWGCIAMGKVRQWIENY